MPVTVSPAIRFSRYGALLIGIGYGYKRNEYLKPYGAKDRKVHEKKAEEQAELKRLREAANEGKSIFDS
ncbi:ATP synthase subunit e, mitochondrial [Paramuricea clavata]|uniref:ATP synthase F(0) complex subunit e, mitochondrial n=1 Tax=Paramuricea clavata TaxID=317549 RepID=A0A7D9DLJ9_PARCT|nr:ATP synthase subunit e, mitochondrial [Paramuricea clavata]